MKKPLQYACVSFFVRMGSTLAFLPVALFLTPECTAQDHYPLPRITKAVHFDGIPDEAFWDSLRLPVVQHQPVFEGAHEDQAEYFMAYDDQYFYLAGRMHYSAGHPIRAVSRKRDSFDDGNDYFGVIIDSFNDNENALAFFTTPGGIRLDFTVFNDAQGDLPFNESWNTFWDVKHRVSDTTWNVEMRIPFSSLRFQDNDGMVTMGATCWWWNSALTQTLIYPAIPRDWGQWSAFKPSKFSKVDLEGVYSRNPVYIAPYVLAGGSVVTDLTEAGTAYQNTTDTKLEAGLDAKISLSNSWTLDLTANTDFAQVEADNQQVNLTRFSLFFPEKRVFFQERSSLFAFTSGPIQGTVGPSLGFNQLFYSRRIGLDSANQPVRIFGGARLIGRKGRWDFGMLDMQTASVTYQPSTNYGVLRLRKQVGRSNSYIGSMLTNEVDTQHNFSTSFGVDGNFDLGRSNYLSLNMAGVADTSAAADMFDLHSSKIYANLTKRRIDGFGYDLTWSRIGAAYNPAMGFELRNNNAQVGNRIWYGWLPGAASKLLNHRLFVEGSLYNNNDDHRNDSGKIGAGWLFELKTGTMGRVMYSYITEYLREDFDLYGSLVQPGSYRFSALEGFVNTTAQRKIRLLAGWYLGTFYDGNNLTLNLMPAWNPLPAFNLKLNGQYVRLRFEDVARNADIYFAGLVGEVSFSTKWTANLLWQYNSYDDQVFGNIRVRYNPREGNDLYIVFNEALNTHPAAEVPPLPVHDSSVVLIKYTYTFVYAR